MKKSITICALVGMTLFMTSASAQFDARAERPGSDTGSAIATRKSGVYAVNLKAIRYFMQNYRGATDVEWSVLKDDSYLCVFRMSGIQYRAFYNPNGSWSYTVSSYPGSQLDKEVHGRVQSVYYNYQIVFANQIDLPGNKTIYLVEIHDGHSIKKVRVADEEMDVIQEFAK